MPDVRKAPADMTIALLSRFAPAITQWDRVDGIPRAHDMSRALRAEVRDPLWMLSRQWQTGEFIGDDAGSPVFAKLRLATTRLTTYRPDAGAEQDFDDTVPFEARVEQRPVPFKAGTQPLAFDLRLLMGRHWMKVLTRNGLAVKYSADFRGSFGVRRPDPAVTADALVSAHREAAQYQAAFAGRAMDGYAWYQWLIANPAPRDFTTVPPPLVVDVGDRGLLDTLGQAFIEWFDRLIDQPVNADENAWEPSRLEYRFECSAPSMNTRKDFIAEEYYSGDLDWYSLDIASPDGQAAARHPEVQDAITTSFIPTSVEFNGMANPRWWSFEDKRVNFAGVQPDTTDIAKLLLIEFGVVYSNDWFLVPLPLDCGTVAEVQGLVVTNVFGERVWIDAAGKAPEHSWQRWSMFTLSNKLAERRPDNSLLILPTVPKVQEGAPLEECVLMRDEMANMVWGVESVVPLPFGLGRSGSGAASETAQFYRRLLGGANPIAPPLPNNASVRYEVMNSVPEHWIPFIPVHVPGDNREIQLQRASMPRVIENSNAPIEKVKPRTSLLREGLDRLPQQAYFLHEEEVPRAGVRVSQSYQRTRWTDGRVFVWLGARKKVGRGEGSSGLSFDRLVEVPKP